MYLGRWERERERERDKECFGVHVRVPVWVREKESTKACVCVCEPVCKIDRQIDNESLCVCVRERERESVCVCMCVCLREGGNESTCSYMPLWERKKESVCGILGVVVMAYQPLLVIWCQIHFCKNNFYFKQFNLAWENSLTVKTFSFQVIQFSKTGLIQTIQFNESTVSMSKTVPFQTIEFSISTQFKYQNNSISSNSI